MKHTYSLVIPVYKNKRMFLDHLEHNFPFMKGNEIIVVDDASHENLSADINKLYPEITVIENNRNLGFGGTVNVGVEKATSEIIILLNSDVRLNSDICKQLDDKFTSQSLFAISFAQTERNGEVVGRNQLYFRNGFFNHQKHAEQKSGMTGWAEGGSMACRSELFTKLGGFYSLYSPFYWEDIDLSFRARSVGYEVLFDRGIIVEHHHESTISKYFKKFRIQKIAFRNQLFFHWINIQDAKLLRSHLVNVSIFLAKAIATLNAASILGFLQALLTLPLVIKYRNKNRKLFTISNAQVISELNKV